MYFFFVIFNSTTLSLKLRDRVTWVELKIVLKWINIEPYLDQTQQTHTKKRDETTALMFFQSIKMQSSFKD